MMDMHMILIVVMVSGVYASVQTHQLFTLNMGNILYNNHTSIKLLKKKRLATTNSDLQQGMV